MKLALQTLFNVRSILSRELIGINAETGERKPVDLRLPISMKRGLRRLLAEVEKEIQIAEPERVEFINKWRVNGVFPEKEDENFEQFNKEYIEMFQEREMEIDYKPFNLELLDNLNEIIPESVEAVMAELNEEYEKQQVNDG